MNASQKNPRFIRLLLGGLLASSLLMFGVGYAQEGPDTPGGGSREGGHNAHRGSMFHQRLTQELGLNEEQQSKLKAIREQGKAKSQSLHRMLRQKRMALFDYIGSPNANEAQALAMQQEVNRLQSEMGALRLKTWFQMRAIMTPEQVQKMTEMQKRMKDKFHQRMQQRGAGFGMRPGGFAGHGGDSSEGPAGPGEF